ncbi:MAG: DNA topoisomerase IB [Alphaproteobacteria bacterium]|nr:DNA topoisomerase IB [Alphaproteobacteria bacterium]MBU0796903.1 DNA topoisomerase IB [Alphaproteobacteria bacterium]MBU0886453.1 DNA topoisomerase IB [Alphaproteobacteria bacterium]MBU1812324.1 DNA topoisomerase IB [Alphaproteobacteria bacterium]MBU2091681.1 DNA topoisomerase IB [Alphaproteobacteria bacterium]
MAQVREIRAQARRAGLRLVTPEQLTLRRQRQGRGFVYRDEDGTRIQDKALLARIRSLAIPPAYRDVRVASLADAHIQAMGEDEAGRIQYRYHPDWDLVREERKIERLATLAQALPRIRRRILRDLKRKENCRYKALAAVVMVIDRSHIRIGCEDYVHSGRSRGAATLLKRNLELEGDYLRLRFHGKRRKPVDCALYAPALAKVIPDFRDLRGSRLFQYRDDRGRIRPVTAGDINAYLREITGAPVTAKDFRTLAATAAAGERLARMEPAASATAQRRQIAAVMRDVAEMLGNTPAVARKSYVHSRLIDAFCKGKLSDRFLRGQPPAGLSRAEAAVGDLFA